MEPDVLPQLEEVALYLSVEAPLVVDPLRPGIGTGIEGDGAAYGDPEERLLSKELRLSWRFRSSARRRRSSCSFRNPSFRFSSKSATRVGDDTENVMTAAAIALTVAVEHQNRQVLRRLMVDKRY